MVRHFMLGLAYLAAMAPAALAQMSTSNSASDANATTNAGSSATSMAGTSTAVINQFQNNPSHTDATVRNVPNVGSIGLFGGTNPCTEGAAGAVSVVGVGVGLGGQWSARACERRNAAVILFQANMPDVAVAVLCQDDEISAAFRAAGRPCPQETKVAGLARAPVAASNPAPAAAATPARAAPYAAGGGVGANPALAGVTGTPQAQGLAMAGPGVPAPAQPAQAGANAPMASLADAGRPVLFNTADEPVAPMRYRGPPPAWCREQPSTPDASAAHAYYCR